MPNSVDSRIVLNSSPLPNNASCKVNCLIIPCFNFKKKKNRIAKRGTAEPAISSEQTHFLK